jgi:hypothetical protein
MTVPTGLAFACLVAGALLGTLVESYLRVDIVPIGVGIDMSMIWHGCTCYIRYGACVGLTPAYGTCHLVNDSAAPIVVWYPRGRCMYLHVRRSADRRPS